MLFKTILTFVCFLASLVALFYFTMQGKDGGIFAALSGDEDKPQPVFYRSIGEGLNDRRRVEPAVRVAQVYTLELTTAHSKGEADLLIAKLLKNKVRAFYSEVKRGDTTVWEHSQRSLFVVAGCTLGITGVVGRTEAEEQNS